MHVQNIALIDELEVDFHEGYNVLTGETGAGKSIIIGAMNAVLGNKLDKSFIREGEESALVELLFSVSSEQLNELCQPYELESNEEGELLISRKVSLNGRSVYKVNGQTVNATVVKALTGELIDIHSQHEHQSLLKPKQHISLLDAYIKKHIEEDLYQLGKLYDQRLSLLKQIDSVSLDEESRRRELSFLEFEIHEIETGDLRIGEDIELLHTYKLLKNQKRIEINLAKVHQLVSGEFDGSLVAQGSSALALLEPLSDLDKDLLDLSEQMRQIENLVHDFARDMEHYVARLEMDDASLVEVEARMDQINSLKQKYGGTIEEILEAYAEKIKRRDDLVHFEANQQRIQGELDSLGKGMLVIAKRLSKERQTGAKLIATQIQEILKELNFKDCAVELAISQKEDIGRTGIDEVEILMSTNKNERLKPLVDIASGGELSRVMLAIKSVFSEIDDVDTLVFDEIDTGISGRTAQKVGEKMVDLSKSRQIICITHLPQLSALADTHYLIEKNDRDDKVITSMVVLNEEAVVEELARLIGGTQITESVRTSAREMKELGNAYKREAKQHV